MLWETCYETGDPCLGDAETIEAAAEFPGTPGDLVKALLTCGGEGRAGFIEPCPGRTGYQVHDLFDHAPDYVKKRLKRELERSGRTMADTGGQWPPLTANGAPPAPTPNSIPNAAHSESPAGRPILDAAPVSTDPASKPPAKGRIRDGLFSAVAAVTHSDPGAAGSHIGRVCKELREADPPFTPAEVRKLPKAIKAAGLDFTLTLGSITKYIGWVRNPPPATKPRAGTDPDLDEQESLRGQFEASGDWHPKSGEQIEEMMKGVGT